MHVSVDAVSPTGQNTSPATASEPPSKTGTQDPPISGDLQDIQGMDIDLVTLIPCSDLYVHVIIMMLISELLSNSCDIS